jgi:hypothetical protein
MTLFLKLLGKLGSISGKFKYCHLEKLEAMHDNGM